MTEFSNPAAYELWMGRWSALLAPVFVDFVGLPSGGRFLDVGSGTGELSAAIANTVEDARIVGIEPAQSYVAYSRTRFEDDRITFEQGDALDIPFSDQRFDGTLSLLILQELADVPKAVREMCRVTRVGGCVAASQWNFQDGMPMLGMFWDAVVETIGSRSARAAAADCMVVSHPDEKALRRVWREAGLIHVETQLKEIDMSFDSFDDYWIPFLSGVTPTSSYTQQLSPEQQNAVRACLRNKVIGSGHDRPFTLIAQAWAIKGSVSSNHAG